MDFEWENATQNFPVTGKYTTIHLTYWLRKTSDFFVRGKYYEESFLVVDSISSNAVTIPEMMKPWGKAKLSRD